MADAGGDRFCYVYSCDLDVNIQIKVGTLEGTRERPSYKALIDDPMLQFSGACQDGCADLYVTCQVYADGRALALPVQTSYKPFTTRWNWNEWITLPLKYSDLPRDALLALTIWDVYGPRDSLPVGGTTISLFGKYGTFRQGMHDLKVWPNVVADGDKDTTTPGKTSGREDEMSRLAKLTKKHRNGRIPEVDWLDRLTFREIEMINERQKRDSNFMYLMIEFPLIHLDGIEYSVCYFEKGGDDVYQVMTSAEMVTVPDPEILQENLVECKHHKLARSLRSGPTDKDLKPNALTRDQLNRIVEYPPTKTLTSEEKDLMWKFRFYLSSQKKALTKFLKSVNWSVNQEAKQALELLPKWSPMDVEDALELLSPAFSQPMLRKYAVARLEQADDEELLLYLLQLVQALKYENFDDIQKAYEQQQEQLEELSSHQDPLTSPPSPFHGRVAGSLNVENSPSVSATTNAKELMRSAMAESVLSTSVTDISGSKSGGLDLATFLIGRACNNPIMANYFHWYLRVECDDQGAASRDPRVVMMYLTMLKRFSLTLNNGGLECCQQRAIIARQQIFMERIVQLVKVVARENANRKKKIEKLQSLLDDPEALRYNFANFDPIPLPLDPDVKIRGIVSEEALLYKSNLMPCRFVFKTMEDSVFYPTLFKHGDDLRQDQLVLQIITLMDKLLRKENLDLRLTPYKVLATSSKHGFVQLIESVAVADILLMEGSLVNYYKKIAPSESTAQGISKEVIDNFIKSCAGYCVITYLLGVGDRHLDNLLMTKSGKLFHIDFGYILGRDPKPLPPPMKLTKEMVDLMGGTNSDGFLDFKKLCYTAFLHLRRSANLILNLFSLMVDANIPDIALEPDKAVRKVQDKFCLDLSDEEAVQYMQSLIDVSVSATMAALMEQMHKIAQYWRK